MIKVIRAQTAPAGVKSKFDVYVDGKFVRTVQAYTPQDAKKVFERVQELDAAIDKAIEKVTNETPEEKLVNGYYSPLRDLFR